MAILLSFDIDGTLEAGDPPGPITMEMVRRAHALGCIVGSCSDKSLAAQQAIWDRHGIQASFVSLKHLLGDVKARFSVEEYFHIGDRNLDQQFALRAGFSFWWMHEGAGEPWLGRIPRLG